MDPFCYLCFVLVFVIPSSLFSLALWSPAGRGWPLGSLVGGVFLVFCCFPILCPRSGMVPACINS